MTYLNEQESSDRRVQKTRLALRQAFVELVLSRRYDDIKVADIIKKANVGRSTFYEHFSSKDDILADSLHGPLSQLADCLNPEQRADDLLPLMDHFWENRSMARLVLMGTPGKQVKATLEAFIEQRLMQLRPAARYSLLVPYGMAASTLAQSQMCTLIDWLTGRFSCSPQAVATLLDNQSKAALNYLCE